MNRLPRRLTTGTLAALLVLGLLPGAVLAADPVAVSRTATTAEDTLVTITVSATDDDGDGLSFSTDTGPANGSLSSYAIDCELVDPLACTRRRRVHAGSELTTGPTASRSRWTTGAAGPTRRR